VQLDVPVDWSGGIGGRPGLPDVVDVRVKDCWVAKTRQL
jgi:hypothetical protein